MPLGKKKIAFLKPNGSEIGFCVSILNRSIQDFSDHGASKEPKNPLWKWIIRYLWRTMIRENLWLTCLVKKHKIPFWILSDWRIQSSIIQSSIFLKKRTLNSTEMKRLVLSINFGAKMGPPGVKGSKTAGLFWTNTRILESSIRRGLLVLRVQLPMHS